MAVLDLIGTSGNFRAVLDEIKMVAPVDSAVLIQGETGTGKELIARAIHDASPRHSNRFVALNCAAIPGTLLESELFGHERGAFTGAVAQTAGRFQQAHRGTLFLDEIGDLPLELQPKLLRVLEEKQFERVGGSRTVQVDVRIVAATNQDLCRLVQEGKFRADLYYRLNVFPISLPPLRERKGDIPLLVEHFVQKFAQRQGKSIDHVPDEGIGILQRHEWPGNIRELQNVIERAVILTTGNVLDLGTLGLLAPKSRATTAMNSSTLAHVQKAQIMATLRETNWVVGGQHGAAARLGLNRTTLIAIMQRLGISRETSEQRVTLPNPFVVAPGGHSYAAENIQPDDAVYHQSHFPLN